MSEKKLIGALSGKKYKTPPIWLMRQAGRYLPEYNLKRKEAGSFLDLCYNSDLASEVTLQPIERFGFDAAIIFSDILVLPHALGIDVEYIEGTGPVLGEFDIRKIQTGQVYKKLKPVFDAIKKTKKKLPENVAMIGFAGSPWTVATYIIEGGTSKDFTQAKLFAYKHEHEFSPLIDMLVEETIEYLCGQIDAGVEVIQLFDSWAGVLSEKQFDRWVISPTIKIIGALREYKKDIKIIGFPKGAGALYKKFVRETGVDGVSIDASVPLLWAEKNLQPYTCVQGNLDPALLASSRNGLVKEVKRIKKVLGKKPFIFNLGHGILPETPIENVELLIDVVRGK